MILNDCLYFILFPHYHFSIHDFCIFKVISWLTKCTSQTKIWFDIGIDDEKFLSIIFLNYNAKRLCLTSFSNIEFMYLFMLYLKKIISLVVTKWEFHSSIYEPKFFFFCFSNVCIVDFEKNRQSIRKKY